MLGGGLLYQISTILIAVVVAGGVYIAFARLFRVQEITDVLAMVKRKLGGGREDEGGGIGNG